MVNIGGGLCSVGNSASGNSAGGACDSCQEKGKQITSIICFFRAKYDFDYEEFDSISAQAKVSYSLFCPVVFQC